MTTADLDVSATARRLVDLSQAVVDAALSHGARATEGGARIDDFQVHTERLAYLATQVRAAHEQVAFAERLAAGGVSDALQESMALVYAAEVAHALRSQVEAAWDDFGLSEADVEPLHAPATREAVRAGMSEARIRQIGRAGIGAGGANHVELEDEVARLTREMARDFAKNEVAPRAQEIHRGDLLIPDDLLAKFSAQGFFGSSIPEQYGGTGMGDLPMIIMTEELSAASLAGAGSLATRPEILTKALLAGGTEEQHAEWLPKIASGEVLVAVAVTEPDTGSDVASLQTRAEPAEHDGERGWRINGAKAWSTFSGRATLLALLARTDPDPQSGSRGLSLFMIEKPAYDGHQWRFEQPEGGVIEGTANPTPGYRGMHSFTLAIDNLWVPHTRLVGGDDGINRGFYLQMGGFAAGRLQTGGARVRRRAGGAGEGVPVRRAAGAVRDAARRVPAHAVQGRPDGDAHRGGAPDHLRIGARLRHPRASSRRWRSCWRATSPATSRARRSCCTAVGATPRRTRSARYVVDALVLPIFEGVKPILELKVIGRALLAAAAR